MKKIVTMALILTLTVSMLTGCGGGNSSPAPADKPAATPAATDKPAAAQAPAPAADSKGATAEQLKQLQQKNIKLAAVYNEVAPLAVKNGWDADPSIVKVLNAVEATIQTYNGMIKDPTLATKSADMPDELSAADELIKILDTDVRANVSKPFSGK